MHLYQIILTCLIWTWASAEAPSFFVKRHYKGDLFEHKKEQNCSLSLCSASGRQAVPVPWQKCQCQCLPLTPTFRQDTGQCVDTLDECQLVPFQSPVVSENIPLVSMPDSGKYVHPSAELALGRVANHFNDVVCHVLVGRFLGPSGWLPLANLSHTGPILQLVYNSKKIFLQFVGDEHEKSTFDGHLIMVEFTCKTKTNANIVPHPCAAFRVAGKLPMIGTKDVLIAVESSSGRLRDWIIIGLGAGLLGVTYVLAILVYLVVRKRYEKKMSSANSQLWSITEDDRSRIERTAMKMTSTCEESTSEDFKSIDAKVNSGRSFSGALQNPPCVEDQSGPSRLLSQLRSAWNAATMKLRGRRLTFSSSLENVTEDSASFCRSIKSSESTADAASRSHSPLSIGSLQSTRSSTGSVAHLRGVRISDGVPDPIPLLSGLQRSTRNRNHFADGSARIANAQKLPKLKKKKPQSSFMESTPDRCTMHQRRLTDSMRRKAASCDNITVLTVEGASELSAYSAGSGINNWAHKKDWYSGYHSTRWEDLRRGQEKSMMTGRKFGIERSESTCSIDCKRKSVSFDLRDTVILGDPSVAELKAPSVAAEQGLGSGDQRHLLYADEDCAPASDSSMQGSKMLARKMTSFATLHWQSKSNEFLHLNDYPPHKSVIRIGRSESNAGEYGMGAVQRMLEGEESQPLASILKRSESQSAVHPSSFLRQKCAQHGSLEKSPGKFLIDSFNPKTSSLNTATPPSPGAGHGADGRGLENKRIWQVVNEDSGYHSSDSDKSLKQCGNGQRAENSG